MKFQCYSEAEDMGKCKTQCEFCMDHYVEIAAEKVVKRRVHVRTSDDQVITVRVPLEIFNTLESLRTIDNRNMSNLVQTMILNELDKLDYKFNDILKQWVEENQTK